MRDGEECVGTITTLVNEELVFVYFPSNRTYRTMVERCVCDDDDGGEGGHQWQCLVDVMVTSERGRDSDAEVVDVWIDKCGSMVMTQYQRSSGRQ